MSKENLTAKRVVIIHWKDQKDSFEVFSNLKNLCLSYPMYNYNTLNNYLSKEKIAYENKEVRIERKYIISQPKKKIEPIRIAHVVKKGLLKDLQQYNNDIDYWLQQSPGSRMAAVTFIMSQSLKPGQRMDKTIVNKLKMKG